MDTRSHSAFPGPNPELPREQFPPQQDKISAYYSLVFPGWTFYIQMLSITIGRRCAPNTNAPTTSTAEQAQVDVDLGNLKSVSRLHAKIEYDQDEDRFVLVVIGRNGAWVDGVWCGAGSRAMLGERSHIQIASRTFTFVPPPPSPPEDTPSPSSQSSANRARSPSVDITSISPPSSQPPNSPPPRKAKLPPPSPEPEIEILQDPEPVEQPQLPNSNSIGKGRGVNLKKRKKGDEPLVLERPEVMPPKPPFTYAQLIYRAIKATDGKATLQEICNWIMTTYDYYKYADSAWMSSVRHNLSSGRAFLKMERCGGDRGKGFFWSIDDKYAQNFEEQETRALQNAAQGTGGKDGSNKSGKRKEKNVPLDPPLKRSIKGEPKGPLPPPLTSAPLISKTVPAKSPPVPTPVPAPDPNKNAATGVFAYNTHAQATPSPSQVSSSAHPSSVPSTNPYAVLARSHWESHPTAAANASKSPPSLPVPPLATTPPTTATFNSPTPMPTPSTSVALNPPQQSTTTTSARPSLPPINTSVVPDVVIPIILGPIPPTHPDYTPGHPNNSAKPGYMILHERKLILDPDVFFGLTQDMLKELEKMGAMAAVKVLTGHMVRALKERRAKNKNKEKNAKKAAKAAKKVAATAAVSISTPGPSVPLSDAPDDASVVLIPQPVVSVSVAAPSSTVVEDVPMDPGSPIIIIDDSEDEAPATKRRKLDDGGTRTNVVEIMPMVV
ncbi:Forkhead box protein K2 [Leucoagaricus sp. SymC.cos]|nr:Forkhead box protein K2 [Leucoagaricus sp. SymC.cos]